MKQNNRKRIFSMLLMLLLAASVTMTSCATSSHYNNFLKAYENNKNNASSETTQGSSTTDSSTPPIQNNITIEGGDAVDVSYAAASGLRSIVSIYATYQNDALFDNVIDNSGMSGGSGVIYRLEADGSAFIITNYHVVYHTTYSTICNDIQLFLFGMEGVDYSIPATYVGGSANYDIAVLRVEKSEVLKKAMERGAVSAATIANSDAVVPGQTAIAIGNPIVTGQNLDGSVTVDVSGISVTSGIVSVDSEYITMNAIGGNAEIDLRVVRIDTAVNPGNSGGGLFNAKGELIGVVNAKTTSSKVDNIGYAIPSNVARAISDNIIDYCYGKTCKTVMRVLLGITVTTTELSTSFDAETGRLVRNEEVSVYEVTAGGLGESILQAGDIIKSITIGDKTVKINRQYQLIDAMLDVRVGDSVSLGIVRNETEMTVSTVITEACVTAY